MRSSAGYSQKYVPDEQGKLQTDEKSLRFAKHVLSFGPESHRDHEPRGTYPTATGSYAVLCSCFAIVRVRHSTIAAQEAHIR